MQNKAAFFLRLAVGVVTALAIVLFSIWLIHIGVQGDQIPTQTYLDKKLSREHETFTRLQFNLVDPSQAPIDIRLLARKGFDIIVNTQTHAKEYSGDKLNCTNCHFAGGNTSGGPQGGLSLVGVAAKYPAFDKRMNRVIDLPKRINNCFERSMNGKPVPRDSETMLALVTYLHWISKNLPIYAPVPWLGEVPLQTQSSGDPAQGKRLYNIYCALCHRDNGEGGDTVPPVWGKGSFNKQAGFNDEGMLAAFIYWNMPYMDTTPVLTEVQAQDVAAYVLSQPRN